MKSFRGEQQRELEQLRAKINREFDRARKLHEREFDVLPEAWSRFVVAHDHVSSFVHPFQQYPDLKRMSDARLEEFLEGSSLTGTEKDEIRVAEDRNARYMKIIFFHKYADTMNAMWDFNRYFRNNGIFIEPTVSEKFQKLLDMMHGAVIEHHINEPEDVRPRMRDSSKKLEKDGGPLFEEIKRDVQGRLWDSQISQG